MKRKLLLTLLCAALLFGCTVQEAHLVYRPEPTSDPTAVPTATPDPVRLDIPAVTGEPFKTDANGVLITDEATHYYEYYVTLNNLRIYEYEQGTYLDATLVNSFPQTLTGNLRLYFRDGNGVLYGYGDLYTAGNNKLVCLPGENRVYADILTEIDVQMMDFTIDGSLHPQES